MEKRSGRVAAEICGAVVGAGFASGKEIASFFSRFGRWSWVGILLAVAVVGAVCLGVLRHPGVAGMPPAWHRRAPGRLWTALFTGLMAATGGAMLAGAGEVAALLLPVRGAYWLGMGATLVLAWLLSGRELKALPVVSRVLIVCLSAVVVLGAALPRQEAASLRRAGWTELPAGMLCGACYGGFNVALACPAAADGGRGLTEGQRRRCTGLVCLTLGLLLCCGNLVLLRSPGLQGETLPFLRMLAPVGKAGYYLCGAALYLAALTTLAAALRGLRALLCRGYPAGVAALAALSLGGLERLVARVYPLLGAGCLVLLALAMWQNRTKP